MIRRLLWQLVPAVFERLQRTMLQVLTNSWALLFGMFLLMIGNGMQGTLLGLRGEAAGFATWEVSAVMSAYFAGFLLGSQLAPQMIRRVGHVRVFAALGSLISAVLIVYPAFEVPIVWILGRVLIGFAFSAVYVTAESWLNNSASNETRGKALSLYMLVQMGGIVSAQFLLLIEDTSGFLLFVIPSILVSLAFAPILLSVSPTPAFETTKPMRLRELVAASPLASVGMVLLGGVFAAQFGMAAVFASRIGLGPGEISLFISSIYIAALVAQYPVGWLSDRVDRRKIIVGSALVCTAGGGIGFLAGDDFALMVLAGALVGGASNPLYSLLIAYANDYLEHEDMAAASAGFVFINGIGAVAGPIVIGWTMEGLGASGFWLIIAALMGTLTVYGLYRMTVRPVVAEPTEAVPYQPVGFAASPVAVELAQEVYIETELDEAAQDV